MRGSAPSQFNAWTRNPLVSTIELRLRRLFRVGGQRSRLSAAGKLECCMQLLRIYVRLRIRLALPPRRRHGRSFVPGGAVASERRHEASVRLTAIRTAVNRLMRSPEPLQMRIPLGGCGPAVLVIHSWWGLTAAFLTLDEALAGQGFVVGLADHFGGRTATVPAEARLLRSAPRSAKLKGSRRGPSVTAFRSPRPCGNRSPGPRYNTGCRKTDPARNWAPAA